jgi:prepilin-type N-terminal cleavage/methylation domain-containing protein
MRSSLSRHASGWTLIEIMVVLAIIAGLTASVSVAIPIAIDRSNRQQCAGHLTGLGVVYQQMRAERPGRPLHNGQSLFLSWRKKRDPVRFGEEDTLLCPGDPSAVFPRNDDDRARWDDVDLAHPDPDLCSFAVRDFRRHPTGPDGKVQIIACDRQGATGDTSHHRGGINVLFDNGTTRFLDREELGLGAGDPIVVGPDAEHEMLRQVVTVSKRE